MQQRLQPYATEAATVCTSHDGPLDRAGSAPLTTTRALHTVTASVTYGCRLCAADDDEGIGISLDNRTGDMFRWCEAGEGGGWSPVGNVGAPWSK